MEVKGFAKLTESQRKLFDRVYDRHMAAMGTELRKKYSLDQLKEIKWGAKEKCLKVSFKNGDWWRYDLQGSWY